MTVTRLAPGDYTTSRWSGGTTTELLIRPRGALYAQRDFLCRLSSATVDLDRSTFTALPDYDRLIATLEGTITLVHDGGAPLTLAPYEVHAFDGGSETISLGRCRDFNLMLCKGRAAGSLRALTVADAAAFSLDRDTELALLYCAEGACDALAGDTAFPLQAGESLLVEDGAEGALTLRGHARLMVAQVRTI